MGTPRGRNISPMRISAKTPESPSQFPRLAVFVTLSSLMMFGLLGWIEWGERLSEVNRTKTFVLDMASSLARDTEDMIEITDTAVLSVVSHIESVHKSVETLTRLVNKLAEKGVAEGRFNDIIVLGPDGGRITGSGSSGQLNFADRDYFRHHRDSASVEAFLGPPIRNRNNGKWSITLSRRVQSASGEFDGVVAAVIELPSFVSRYAIYDLGNDSVIGLSNADGVLLARYPEAEKFTGQKISDPTILSFFGVNSAGFFARTSRNDGVRRFVGFHRTVQFDLVVWVAISQDQALGRWRTDMYVRLLIACTLIGSIVILGLHLVWQTWRSQTAEKRVRESEERYRVLMEKGIVTEAIYMLDADGNIQSWNAAAEQIKGYAAAEIIGQNISIFLLPEEIDRGDVAYMLATARQSGQFIGEALRSRKDGTRFLAAVTLTAVYNDDGTLRGFANVTRDVTHQRRIEEEQRAIIIESAPNGMLIINENGVITLANSRVEELFGYAKGELAGQSIMILLPNEFLFVHVGEHTDSRSGSNGSAMTIDRETVGRAKDGSEVFVEVSLNSVKTQQGRIIIASLFDVTERQRRLAEERAQEARERLILEQTTLKLENLSRHLNEARDRAERANGAKSRFLTAMSHELRTPLNSILGYAELLHMDGGLTAAQSTRVNAMLTAGTHLLEMIKCVLDLSEIEAEHVALHIVEVDVRAEAQVCLDLVRPSAALQGLTLHLTVEPCIPRCVVTDPTRLRQVMLNLLGNAVKFTAKGSIEVRIRHGVNKSTLRIEVWDTGPGIPAEQRHRLFKEFERLDTEATSNAVGAGLGLALSARLAVIMGGRLGHDDNPSGGSVFWLDLPLSLTVATDTVLPLPHDESDRAMGPTHPLRILIADDVVMIRDVASAFLHDADHLVTCVESGAAAVEAAAAADFDVIVMDVHMPGIDGLEATRRIRALGGARGQVPIVALTADAFTEQVDQCLEVGMDCHLAKPFTRASLIAAVSNAVTKSICRPEGDVNPVLSNSEVVGAERTLGLGWDLPVINPSVFDATATLLASDTVASYLKTLVGLGEIVLKGLNGAGPSQRSDELAQAVNGLVSIAGAFGFECLTLLGHRYQIVMALDTPERPPLTSAFSAAIKASLDEVNRMDRITGRDSKQIAITKFTINNPLGSALGFAR